MQSQSEIHQRLDLSTDIVGRDNEIAELRNTYVSLLEAKSSIDATDDFTARDGFNATACGNMGLTSVEEEAPRRTPSVYVRGVSGAGKSALIKTAFLSGEFVQKRGGYFCEGKFELMISSRPFAPLMDAFETLCSQVLSRHHDDEEYIVDLQSRIVDKIPIESLCILLNSLPSLAAILKKSKAAAAADAIDNSSCNIASRSATATHAALGQGFRVLKRTLLTLIDILITDDEQLVLFIDDLQWANIDSLEIIEEILANAYPTKCLFVGGFRSNEVDADHILSVHMADDKSRRGMQLVIEIRELRIEHVTTFISSTVKREEKVVKSLAEFVHEKTGGNIYFVKHYLRFLQGHGHLYYSVANLRWEWDDVAAIQDGNIAETDLEEVVCTKIRKLPKETVDAMMVASCLGTRFDIEVIEFMASQWQEVCRGESPPDNCSFNESSSIEEILWHAVEQDLLEETKPSTLGSTMDFSVFYKFTHDKVQSSVYSMIGKDLQPVYHLQLGNLFLALHESPAGKPWMQIVAADHLCQAEMLITSRRSRDIAATVCLRAAERLRSTAAFRSAAIFARNAINFLDSDAWSRNYNLCLEVYNLSAEAEFYAGNGEQCNTTVKVILSHAREFSDTRNAYLVYIENLNQTRRFVEALETGKDMLRKMNICRIPRKTVTAAHMALEVMQTLMTLKKFSEEDLVKYGETEDPTIALFAKVCITLMTCAHFAGSKEDFVYFSLRALRLSLRHGYCKVTPAAMMISATVFGSLRLYSIAKRLGRVALKVMKRFEAPEMDTLTLFIYYQFVYHMDNKMGNAGQKHSELHQLGISSGSVVWACMNSCVCISTCFWEGSMRLDKLLALANKFAEECVLYNKPMLLPVLSVYRQIILNFLGRNEYPSRLQGDAIVDLHAFMQDLDPANSRYFTSVATQCAVFYGDWDEALSFAITNTSTENEDHPIYFVGLNRFLRCLVWISLYERDGSSSMKRRARREYRRIQGMMKHGLESKKELLLVLDAEVCARLNKKTKCLHDIKEKYDVGIASMEAMELHHYGALVRERAAEFFAKNDQPATAELYLEKAVETYRNWGAMGKVW